MSFSFLNPWLWLGAIAIGAPLWLHLRRRREQNVVVFSALRFLEDQPVAKASPWRLRNVLLFALRALIVLLVVAAFAWPYVRGRGVSVITESTVYILDSTLSHQAGNQWADAHTQLVRAVRDTPVSHEFAVIELTSTPRLVVPFGSSIDTAVAKLDELSASSCRGSYLAAFHLAESLLAKSFGSRRRIVLLGDNQANQWNEERQTPPFLSNVEIELPKTRRATRPNLSLSDARVQRVFMGDQTSISFSAKLHHTGPAVQASISVRANGREVLARNVSLTGQPETLLLQSQWVASSNEWVEGSATVGGAPDDLAGDNVLYFTLPPVSEGKVALLAQSPYLRLALSPEVMRGEWQCEILNAGKIDEAKAPGFDVLCVESSFLQSGPVRLLVSDSLRKGKGVILFLDRVTPAVSGFLREQGFQTADRLETPAGTADRIAYACCSHPLFHPFISSDYGNLTEVELNRFFKLTTDRAVPLAFAEGGSGVIFHGGNPPGNLFLFAFAFNREQTSWPVHQTFIPFLDLLLQNARATDEVRVEFEPGEMSLFRVPRSDRPDQVSLWQGRKQLASAQAHRSEATIKTPAAPGVYEIRCENGNQLISKIAVNPPAQESILDTVDGRAELSAWTLPAHNPSVQTEHSGWAAAIPTQAILQQKLWWWLVLASVLALVAEMGVSTLARERT